MEQCIATVKSTGVRCEKAGHMFEGHCGVHFKSKLKSDTEFKARYEAAVAETARQRAAAEALAAARHQRMINERRQRKRDEAAAAIAAAPNMNVTNITRHANELMQFWNQRWDSVGMNDSPVYAYHCLKNISPRHDGFPALIRTTTALLYLTQGRHPEADEYENVPEAERVAALQAVTDALQAYGDLGPLARLLPRNDVYAPPVATALRRRAEAEQIRRLEAEAAARRAAAQAQLEQDLRQRPVVFQRDPEGSINLAAFANDEQSVHRSSVQATTERAIRTLLAVPLGDGQVTLEEIHAAFDNTDLIRWNGDAKEKTLMTLDHDYFNVEAFSTVYGDVLDHVWAIIRNHQYKRGLVVRLAQEVLDGRKMCTNGKMARLINVLQGFDDTVELDLTPPREHFQNKIAALAARPLDEREAAARSLFAEYNIPAAEHDVWLEPLLSE
jgi:hypothetical protein